MVVAVVVAKQGEHFVGLVLSVEVRQVPTFVVLSVQAGQTHLTGLASSAPAFVVSVQAG